MTAPTHTQSLILSNAAQRPGNQALPLPEGLHGAAARTVVGKMIARFWLEEVDISSSRGAPLWRETGDGRGTTLIATAAGLKAVGIEAPIADADTGMQKAEPEPVAEVPVSIPGRAGTKQAQIIAMLQRPEGASIAEIVAVTGWMPHTARGMIVGALKKKLGLPVTSEKVEGRGTVHRLASQNGFGTATVGESDNITQVTEASLKRTV